MHTLVSIYIACAIFGVGVTIIDMLGILGDLFHEGNEGDDGDTGHDSDSGHGDAEHGELDTDAHSDYAHGDHGHGDLHDGHHASEHGEEGSIASHEQYHERYFLLQVLSIARSLVHFSVGFGPVGLVALATGRSPNNSLAWSIPVGLITCIGGRLLRRIQRNELDSQVKDEDLIMEQGVVSVSIKNGLLGKVRIRLEGVYVERFARAQNPGENFPVGSQIRIVDVADDCVYVEKD